MTAPSYHIIPQIDSIADMLIYLVPAWPELVMGLGLLLLLAVGAFGLHQKFFSLHQAVLGLMILAIGVLGFQLGGEHSAFQFWLRHHIPDISALASDGAAQTIRDPRGIMIAASGAIYGFGQMVVADGFSMIVKILLLVAGVFSLTISRSYFTTLTRHQNKEHAPFEAPILIGLTILGMMVMVSAHDFLILYLGLELQNLALYTLTAIRREQRLGSEAGLKFFALGALSSGLLLFGISLIYGASGSANYLDVATYFRVGEITLPLILGLVIFLCGMAFKISAVPFHMWTPDVYDGAPIPITALMSMAPKIASFAALIRLLHGVLFTTPFVWQQIFIPLALFSMLWGAFAGLRQSSLKRLLAYSTIGHIGYALCGMLMPGTEGISAVLFYFIVYMLMSAGLFTLLLSLRQDQEWSDDFAVLNGLGQRRPLLAASFAILALSLAGIPPLAGFFAKLYVFKAAISAGFMWLAIIGVISSVIAAGYYLNLIRIMYFGASGEKLSAEAVKGTFTGDIAALEAPDRIILCASVGSAVVLIAAPYVVTTIGQLAALGFYGLGG